MHQPHKPITEHTPIYWFSRCMISLVARLGNLEPPSGPPVRAFFSFLALRERGHPNGAKKSRMTRWKCRLS